MIYDQPHDMELLPARRYAMLGGAPPSPDERSECSWLEKAMARRQLHYIEWFAAIRARNPYGCVRNPYGPSRIEFHGKPSDPDNATYHAVQYKHLTRDPDANVHRRAFWIGYHPDPGTDWV